MPLLALQSTARPFLVPFAKEPTSWLWTQRAAAEFERALRAAWLRFVGRLEDNIESGMFTNSRPWMTAEAELLAEWEDIQRGVIERAGQQQDIVLRFNRDRFLVDNPFTNAWLAQSRRAFVTNVSEATQTDIRRRIAEGVRDHMSPVEIARQMRRDHVVGLIPQHMRAVERFRARLEADGAKGAGLDKRVERYANGLRRYRTENIARTEVMIGMHHGTQASWTTASREGLLPRTAKRQWVAGQTERTCEICQAMDGAEAPLDGPFRVGNYVFMEPHGHQQCRCGQVLVGL